MFKQCWVPALSKIVWAMLVLYCSSYPSSLYPPSTNNQKIMKIVLPNSSFVDVDENAQKRSARTPRTAIFMFYKMPDAIGHLMHRNLPAPTNCLLWEWFRIQLGMSVRPLLCLVLLARGCHMSESWLARWRQNDCTEYIQSFRQADTHMMFFNC